MTAQADHFARLPASPWKILGLDHRLTELNTRGLPFSDIAQQLNEEFGTSLSRSACIGRASRMELPHRVTYHAGRVIRRVVPKQASTAKARIEVPRGKLKLIELRSHDCRYPFGEVAPYLYCAQPTVENSSWCPKHFRIVYTSTRAR